MVITVLHKKILLFPLVMVIFLLPVNILPLSKDISTCMRKSFIPRANNSH